MSFKTVIVSVSMQQVHIDTVLFVCSFETQCKLLKILPVKAVKDPSLSALFANLSAYLCKTTYTLMLKPNRASKSLLFVCFRYKNTTQPTGCRVPTTFTASIYQRITDTAKGRRRLVASSISSLLDYYY